MKKLVKKIAIEEAREVLRHMPFNPTEAELVFSYKGIEFPYSQTSSAIGLYEMQHSCGVLPYSEISFETTNHATFSQKRTELRDAEKILFPISNGWRPSQIRIAIKDYPNWLAINQIRTIAANVNSDYHIIRGGIVFTGSASSVTAPYTIDSGMKLMHESGGLIKLTLEMDIRKTPSEHRAELIDWFKAI